MYQQGLPYDPYQQARPFLNFNVNYTPVQFQIASPDPNLDQYTPMMISALITEIQTHANDDLLQRFFFNVMSDNNYNNESFYGLVNSAVIWLAWATNNRVVPGPTHEDNVMYTAAMFVSMSAWAAPLVSRQWAALQGYVTPEMQQGVQAAAADFNQRANEISAVLSNVQQQFQGGAYQGGGGGGYGAPAQRYTASSSYRGAQPANPPSNRWGQNQQRTVQNQPNVQASAGNIFNNNRQGTSGSTTQYQAGSRFSQNNQQQDTSVRGGMDQEQVDTVADNNDVRHILSTSKEAKDIVWKPTKEEPNYPAYSPTRSRLYFVIDADGKITTQLEKIEKTDMDFNEHNIPNIFGGPKKTQELKPVDQSMIILNNALDRIDQEAVQNHIEDQLNPDTNRKTLVHSGGPLVVQSVESGWAQAAMKRATYGAPYPDVFRAYLIVMEPHLNTVDEKPFVRDFSNSSSYQELRKKMIEEKDNVGAELMASVNRRMTQAINRIIKMNLSIPGLHIDSFVDDLDDLYAVLRKRYGERVIEVLDEHAEEVIIATFIVGEDQGEANITEDIEKGYDFDGVEKPKITYLNRFVTMTMVNLLANELDVELSKMTSSTLKRSQNPELWRLLEELFKETDQYACYFAQHLLRTKDGVVLEATRGYFGRDTYQLTMVSA